MILLPNLIYLHSTTRPERICWMDVQWCGGGLYGWGFYCAEV